MLDRIAVNANYEPENLHAAMYEGVIVNSIYSQAFLFGDDMSRFKRTVGPLCACGCGNPVKWDHQNKKWNRYIYSHIWIGRNHTTETKKKISEINLGKILSLETRKKISITLIGHELSKETKQKISIALIGNKSRTGLKHTKETKRKISIANSGEKNGLYGKPGPRLGVVISKETRQKMSIIKKGPLSPTWKGGISCEPYCFIWSDEKYKQSIKDRDNNECQNPDCRHNCDHLTLGLHHIDYIKKNCGPENLITLCNSCNGRANKNRNDWREFYQDIMIKKYGYKYD